MMGKEGRWCFCLLLGTIWGQGGTCGLKLQEICWIMMFDFINRQLFKAESIGVPSRLAGSGRAAGRLEKKCTSKPCLETQGPSWVLQGVWCTDRSCLRFYLTWGRWWAGSACFEALGYNKIALSRMRHCHLILLMSFWPWYQQSIFSRPIIRWTRGKCVFCLNLFLFCLKMWQCFFKRTDWMRSSSKWWANMLKISFKEGLVSWKYRGEIHPESKFPKNCR